MTDTPTPTPADVIEGMREALTGLVALFALPNEDSVEHFERVAALFRRETGYLRPGKDCRLHDRETREGVWDKWVDAKLTAARAALALPDSKPDNQGGA